MNKGGAYLRLLGALLVLAMATYLGAWGFAALNREMQTAQVSHCTLPDGTRALMLPQDALHTDGQGGYYVRTLCAGQVEDRALTVLEIQNGMVIAALEEPFDALRAGNTVILKAPTGD